MEELTQEAATAAQERVAEILHEARTGQIADTAPAPAPAPAPTLSPVPASATRPAKKQTRARRTGTPNQATGSISASTDTLPSVNISLPKEIYTYFQQQADADERTLAKYLQRVLRQVWQQQTRSSSAGGDESTLG